MSEIDLTSQEVKDAIAAAVSEATQGLKDKNTELLGKLKKAQQGQQIDPADLQAVENERDELRTKLTEANKALTKATKDLEAANKRAETAEGATTKLLADNALGDALAKAGITNPAHQRAVKAMFGSEVQIVVEGETKVAKIGDKSVQDALTAWAGTDEGKHFVSAGDNSGGGSGHGGRGNHNPDGKLPAPTGDAAADKAARVATYNARLAAGSSEE